MIDEKESQRLAWHPAFIEALQAVLEDYKDVLEFYPEVQLTSEPLKIDCVVIKKKKNVIIKKDIAAIFRKYNLIEYKSPDKYLSINDFYKVYAYACLYASIKNIPVTVMTISFIQSHYPKKLLKYLTNVHKYTVEKTYPGVYNINGDIFPIQIIDNRHITEEEHIWLKGLSNKLDSDSFIRITDEAYNKSIHMRLGAYIDVIMRANYKTAKEVDMSKTPTLDQILIETGLAAKWEARAEARKTNEIAKRMKDRGKPLSEIAEDTGLSIEEINKL